MSKKNVRDTIKLIFQTAFESLTIKEPFGKKKGVDCLGNVYYEIPANPKEGIRKHQRWYENEDKSVGFEQEVPVEWESWLRGRREEPPTEGEIQYNKYIRELKQAHAQKLKEANKSVIEQDKDESKPTFPKYEEYEVFPGQKAKEP